MAVLILNYSIRSYCIIHGNKVHVFVSKWRCAISGIFQECAVPENIPTLPPPKPPGILVIFQLGWVPSWKDICIKNVVALYYHAKDIFFLR